MKLYNDSFLNSWVVTALVFGLAKEAKLDTAGSAGGPSHRGEWRTYFQCGNALFSLTDAMFRAMYRGLVKMYVSVFGSPGWRVKPLPFWLNLLRLTSTNERPFCGLERVQVLSRHQLHPRKKNSSLQPTTTSSQKEISTFSSKTKSTLFMVSRP